METDLIPGLTEEMSLQCLLRLPLSSHRASRRTSRRWSHLLDSPEFFRERRRTRNTRRLACFVQALPQPTSLLSYALTLYDPVSNKWALVDPPPSPLPLFCQVAATNGHLVVLGGWDPDTWEPIRRVWVYNFAAGMWVRGRDMPAARSSFAAAGSDNDKIYVAGGHDEGRNVVSSAAWYDVRSDEWGEVAEMPEGRDECEGVMIGEELWVVSGFGSETTGRFVGSAEVYETKSGRWRREEGVWPEGRRPRGSAGVGEDGRLDCWAEKVAEVKVGTCAVRMGETVMVAGMGTAFPGTPVDFFILRDGDGGKNGMEHLNPPVEFSGFVQSGCCVEI